MTVIYFGKIYSEKEKVTQKSALTLCGKNISLLNPVLLNTTLIEDNFSSRQFKVTFFQGSRFEQTLSFHTYQTSQLFNDKCVLERTLSKQFSEFDQVNELAKILITEKTKQLDDLLVKNGSWFICNSETLSKEKFLALPEGWRAIEGQGAVFLAKYGIDNAYRQVFLVMLALSYYQALQQMSEELAQVLASPKHHIDELDKLYTEAAIFNARYYFNNPIKFSRYSTFNAWKEIRKVFHLNEKNTELISQLTQVHQILSYTIQKKEQCINERRNCGLTIFGIVLSGLGLIEVIDVLKSWFL